jgi:hypothetical protein
MSLGGNTSVEDRALPALHFVIAVGRHRPNVPLVQFANPKTKHKKQSK